MADFTQTITIQGPDANGLFFRVTRRDHENGEYDERSERLGNALQVQQNYADVLRQQAQSMAGSIEAVSKYKRVIGDMKSTDADIEIKAGVRPSALIVTELKSDFETAGWTIRESEGGPFVPIVFNVNAQNVLRYTVNGGQTKTADLFGAVMRLRNYPASPNDMDMYRFTNGNYSNADRSVVIRRPGSNLNQTTGD